MNRKLTIETVLTLLVMIPMLLCLVVATTMLVNLRLADIKQRASERAQQYAAILADTTSWISAQPYPANLTQLLERQITSISNNPAVVAVRFVDAAHEAAASRPNFDDPYRLRRFASVDFLVQDGFGASSYRHTGYIYVDYSIQLQVEELYKRLGMIAVLWLLIILGLYLILKRISGYLFGPIKRLDTVLVNLREGNSAGIQLGTFNSPIKELNRLEHGIDTIGSQLTELRESCQRHQRELSQMSKREQLALASRDDFQSMITHELKTPLNGIWGGVQLLAGESLTSTQKESLRLIARSSRQLSNLLDQILAMLALEQGRILLHHEMMQPLQLLESLVNESQSKARRKGLHIELEVKHTPDLQLSADLPKIRKILTHLIDNSIKYTDIGYVRLISTVFESPDGELTWRCDVKDSGIGIEHSVQEDIFKPFFQGDSSHNRRNEGAGMGLALAQKLARIMEGELNVSSAPGRGSTFSLVVPVQPWDTDVPDRHLADKRILLIDMGENGEMRSLLVSLGMLVTHFTDVPHALTQLHGHPWSAVMISRQLPQSDITSLVRAFRESEMDSRTPIILLVPQNESVDFTQDARLGVDYWLENRNDRKAIANQLAQWLD